METATNTKVLYTGKTHTTGGREGAASSDDQQLQIKLGLPGSGKGTNPEQLFAAGWSACFIGAMGIAAHTLGTRLPADTAVDAEVDLLTSDSGFSLRARLNVALPGLEKEVAQQIVNTAHNTCPYSKAVKSNIPVEINLV
ncbi:organic hydroperoxide resistance protein [Chitinophaga sp. sic0106]|uniref:organic hydroperoxide resistance protein n=1 Tax=Chitinophaga sp. sic0106 TaxID=2854785 RepID=UPI001C46EF5B|nr:organic hydroperoxide resistance protein [Chitinophaga sp. sic0106]MBV7533082.1 organic hydroperoxide resistance protein [Chitinophaga sp. sic0106]